MYRDYCTGCGLCHTVRGVTFVKDSKGYLVPELGIKDLDFCDHICPSGKAWSDNLDVRNIWGGFKAVYSGWSSDSAVREKASSGGALTTILIYLLEHKMVDGIIHTGASADVPWETSTYLSRTGEEVQKHCGSRYAQSSPLLEIHSMMKPGERYAFVGRPCDCSALSNYRKRNPVIKNSIVYMLSFFCAGIPGESANRKLIDAMGCAVEDCVYLNYRGNGWPGMTTATDKGGGIYRMSYQDAWGNILGRDIQRICRFCIDGLGESADISCGDAWYLTAEGKPDFSEKDGRNVIFANTKEGEKLLKNIGAEGCLHLEDYGERIGELKYIQKYQYQRKGTMMVRLFAMKLFRQPVPFYQIKKLRYYSRHVSLSEQLRMFAGTIRRIIQRKI